VVFARKPYLRSGKNTDIRSIGMKIKMPRGALPKPLESLPVKTLTLSRGQEVKKVEAYFPEDLWIRDQIAGRWGNGGFTVNVYRMTLPVPKAVPVIYRTHKHKYVLKAAYDKWKDVQPKVSWNQAEITEWLEFLTASKLPAATVMTKKRYAKNTVTYFYEVADGLNIDYLYVIVPDKTSDYCFLVQFTLTGKFNLKKSKKTLNQAVASAAFYPHREKVKNDVKFNLKKAKSAQQKKRSPEYLASRERVINNIRNLKDWWYLETDNFIMVANIKKRKTIRELAAGLENSRKVFKQVFPLKAPLKDVSVVKSFETRKEYLSYIGKAYEWTSGVWMAGRKELVVSPMNWGAAWDRRKMMVEVIQHEGFHQYIYFATGGQQTAAWFNEGNAAFFEGLKFKGRRPVIEETYRLAIMAKQNMPVNIAALLKMSYLEFYGVNVKNNYILGYGLMFFLHKGAAVMKGSKAYSSIPTKYYDAVLATKNPAKATEIAWRGVDMKKFTKDFKKFWSSKTLVKRAIRYDLIKAAKNKITHTKARRHEEKL
jgi:hypothetical protein